MNVVILLLSFVSLESFFGVYEAKSVRRPRINQKRINKTQTPKSTTERVYGFRDHVFLVESAQKYPWVASLQKEGYQSGEHIWRHKCTTSILNDLWTITACHCVAYRTDHSDLLLTYYPGDHRVLAGTARLSLTPTSNVRIRDIDQFTYSATCWKDNEYQSNYGGVKMKEKLSFSSYVKPMEYVSEDPKRISMVLNRLQRNKTVCHVVGWGITHIEGTNLLSMSSRVSANQYTIAVQQKSDHFCDNTLCKRHSIYCESGRSQSRNELCAVPLKSDSNYFPASGSCLVCGLYSFGMLSWVYGSDDDSPAVYFFSRFDKPFNLSENVTIQNDIRLRSSGAPQVASELTNLVLFYCIERLLSA